MGLMNWTGNSKKWNTNGQQTYEKLFTLPKPSEENQNQNYIERPYHLSPMTAIEKTNNPCGWGLRGRNPDNGGDANLPRLCENQLWRFPKKTRERAFTWSDYKYPALGIYPKASRSTYSTDPCTWMLNTTPCTQLNYGANLGVQQQGCPSGKGDVYA